MKANSIDQKTVKVKKGEQHRSQTSVTPINEQIDHFDEPWYTDWSGSWTELNLNEVLALRISEVPSYCERVLDLPTLMRDLSGRAEGRKLFCEYLGIGESTLSGWLKEQRVPRMAKEAYVLLKTLLLLQDEVTRLNEEKLRNDVVIVQEGDRFQLVRFKADNTGALMGGVIARDIPDEGAARILAGSTKAFDMLKDFRDAAIDIIGDTSEPEWEDASYLFKQLNYRLLRDSLAAFGIEEWIKRFLPYQVGPLYKNMRAWQILAEVDPARADAQLPLKERLAKAGAELNAAEEAIAELKAELKAAEVEWEAAAKAIAKAAPERIARLEAELKAAEADLKAIEERAAAVSPPSSARGDSGSRPTAVEDAAQQEKSLGKRGANGKAKT